MGKLSLPNDRGEGVKKRDHSVHGSNPHCLRTCVFPCRYIVSEQEKQFITQQLCSMLAVFDLSDEVGR